MTVLRLAEPSRKHGKPRTFRFVIMYSHKSIALHPRTLLNPYLLFYLFPTPAEEESVAAIAAATYSNIQQQEYISVGRHVCCTKPFDGWCSPSTENVRDHETASLGPSTWENMVSGIDVIPSKVSSRTLSAADN